jgi:hypothetical protein
MCRRDVAGARHKFNPGDRRVKNFPPLSASSRLSCFVQKDTGRGRMRSTSEAASWSATTIPAVFEKANPARVGIASLMSIVAALCIPQRSDANTVGVMITGKVISGTDGTPDAKGYVFGGGEKGDLTNAKFTVNLTIDDRYYSTYCSNIYSCLSGNIKSFPMRPVNLTINGDTVNGNGFSGTFTYINPQFNPTVLYQTVSRQLNVKGYAAFLNFSETEQAYTEPYSGNAYLTTPLYVDAVDMHPCWEQALPAASTITGVPSKSGDPAQSFSFFISVYENNEAKSVAEGNLEIHSVTITPVDFTPPYSCDIKTN